MRTPRLLVALVFAVLVGGCSGTGPAPTAASAPDALPRAPTPQAGADTGALTGVVTDSELVPLQDVMVAIRDATHSALTDSEGVFTFNGLAPGRIEVFFERWGFESQARSTHVAVGEVTRLNTILQPLPIIEPYHLVVPRVGQIKLGQFHVQFVQATVNNALLDQQLCDPCKFPMPLYKNVTDVLTETSYTRSSSLPKVNENVQVSYVGSTGGLTSTYVLTVLLGPHGRAAWGHAVTILGNLTKLGLQLSGPSWNGATAGIDFQQRVETWTTFAFNGPLDANFTALQDS
jgi:hypothetical protein